MNQLTYYYAYVGEDEEVTISSTDKEIVKVEFTWGAVWSLNGLAATNGTFTNSNTLENVNATTTTITCPNNGGAELYGVKVYYNE